MPIYEYECSKCGHQQEVWQKISDKPLIKCESCHGKLRKLISQSTFHLKGTGWYVTDYASKGTSGTSESRKPETGTSSQDSATKETKSTGDKPKKGEASTKSKTNESKD